MKPVDGQKIEERVYFGVITEIPDGFTGNYATGKLLINPEGKSKVAGSDIIATPPEIDQKLFCEALERGESRTTLDLTEKQIVFCNTPVFRLGEILVIGENGRTIPDGRKPYRWAVGCECFDDIESAVKRAREVYN